MSVDSAARTLIYQLVPDWDKYSARQLARAFEKAYGYSIYFAPVEMPAGFYGAIGLIEDEDSSDNAAEEPYIQKVVILYDRLLQSTHLDHVLTHELAHLLLGHNSLSLTISQARAILANPGREDLLTIEYTCYAGEHARISHRRHEEELEAEELTRWIYENVFRTQQEKHREPMSADQDFDSWLQGMGLV